MRHIYKYGLIYSRRGKLLLCKTYKFPDLILPGGKKEGTETATEGLNREIQEELGDTAILDRKSLRYIGNFSDYAAGKKNTMVDIELYWGDLSGELKASSEIAELVWFDVKNDDINRLSAIIKNHILPAIANRLDEFENN